MTTTSRGTSHFKPEIVAKYSSTIKPPFQCKECDFSSLKMNALVLHTNRKHGNVKVPNEGGRKKMGRPRGSKNKPGAKWELALTQDEAPPAPPHMNGSKLGRPRKQQQTQVVMVEPWPFCPKCGYHLSFAEQAVAVAESNIK